MTTIAMWKTCRHQLGPPLLQKVVDFDPSNTSVDQKKIRSAISTYKEIMQYKDELWPAAAALYDWLGAVFWVRKEMRAASNILQLTTVSGLNKTIAALDVERVRTIVEVLFQNSFSNFQMGAHLCFVCWKVDLFSGEGVDEAGNTSLHAAAAVGPTPENQILTKLLLSMDGAPHMLGTADKIGKTAMHHAVERGISPMVSQLRASGAALDTADHSHFTSLMYAVKNQDLALVQQLCEAGADANIVTEAGAAMDFAQGWADGQAILQEFGAMTSGALAIKARRERQARGEEEEGDAEAEAEMAGEEEYLADEM